MSEQPSSPKVTSGNDDAIPAMKATSKDNQIVLFTPTMSARKGYPFDALGNAVTSYDKNVLALEYHPESGASMFTARHDQALADESTAGVIVVLVQDGSNCKATEAFAETVWQRSCKEEETAGVLVLIGGTSKKVGGFQTVVQSSMSDEAQVAIAKAIFG